MIIIKWCNYGGKNLYCPNTSKLYPLAAQPSPDDQGTREWLSFSCFISHLDLSNSEVDKKNMFNTRGG